MTDRATLEEACDREGVLDDTGYSPHHCFFRSEYKEDDYDDSWNIEPLRFSLHEEIHNGNRLAEAYYKKKAFLRYEGKYSDKLSKILRRKSYGVK